MSKEARQQVGVARKILIAATDNQNDVLRWFVVQPTFPNLISMSDYRENE